MGGRKSKIIFDSIDLQIIDTIKKNPHIHILQLRDKIEITHQNLKKHLEKLIKGKLILSWKNEKSPKITLTTLDFYEEDYDFLDDEYKKDVRDFEGFFKIINKINSLEFESETLREMSTQIFEDWVKKKYKQQ